MGIINTVTDKLWRAFAPAHLRADSTFGLMALNQTDRPVWSPRSYSQFSREAYMQNIVTFRCIQLVAGGVASIPWVLSRETSEGKREELKDHPFIQLINRPNPQQDRYRYMMELIGFYLIAGNSYTEEISPTTRRDAAPRELWIKRPDRMKVIPGKVGIAGYEWRKDGGTPKLWKVNQVTGQSQIKHFRSFHPLNDFYGMSPIEAAAQNVDQHNEADLWNMGLLKNAAAPSGALETDMPLGETEIKLMLNQWRQQKQGSANAGNVVALTHGMKWKGLSLSPRDMLLMQSKSFTARFICLAFGVPPFIIGLPEGVTYANFSEARLALWDETIIPLAMHIQAEFKNWLLPKFVGEAELDRFSLSLRLDEMPALELRRKSKWQRVLNAVTAGTLTPNDARKELGWPTVEGGDVLLLPLNAEPVSAEEDVSASDRMDTIDRRLEELYEKFNGDYPSNPPNSDIRTGGRNDH